MYYKQILQNIWYSRIQGVHENWLLINMLLLRKFSYNHSFISFFRDYWGLLSLLMKTSPI